MRLRFLAVLLPVVLFFGCATRGKDFPSDVSWVKNGVTSKTDAKQLLGPPFQVGFASGYPTWTYGYYRYRLFGNSHTKEMKFYWDKTGRVHNMSFTSSFPADVKRQAILNKSK